MLLKIIREQIPNINQDAVHNSTDQFKALFFQSQANEFPPYNDGDTPLYPKLIRLQPYSGSEQITNVNIPLITLIPLRTYQVTQVSLKLESQDEVIIDFPKEPD